MAVLVSAHNPVTGPRHLGHHVSTMMEWPALQDEFECFFVIDDVIATLMYPSQREMVLNRSMFVARDFLASGIDRNKSSIVLVSTLIEHFEVFTHFSNYIDQDYCRRLYDNSFMGRLAPHERASLGLDVHPTIAELIYPQFALPALTIALNCEKFQGGIEVSGYVHIINEIVQKFNARHGHTFNPVDWLKPRVPYLSGTDGTHMINNNAWFLASDLERQPDQIRSRSMPESVLSEWIEALYPEFSSSDPSGYSRDQMIDMIRKSCDRYRRFDVKNDEIAEVLCDGAARAKYLLRGTLSKIREAIGIRELLEF